MTVLGTRPEIIRLSLIISKLDLVAEHTLVHTGQNYEPELDALFFSRLAIRAPDRHLDARAKTSFGQIAKILAGVEAEILCIRPDACLILGDTNSGLAAMVAEKLGVPVFHMEAGNRCFDRRGAGGAKSKNIAHMCTPLPSHVE